MTNEKAVVMTGRYDRKEIYALEIGELVTQEVYNGEDYNVFLNRVARDFAERIYNETNSLSFGLQNGFGVAEMGWKTMEPLADIRVFEKLLETEVAKRGLREVRKHMRTSSTGIQAILDEGGLR